MSVPDNLKAIVVDGEWRIGHGKMDLLIICTLDYKVYLFHLAEICKRGTSIPTALKQLLEDPTVKKVGNRIYNDVNKLKGWDVDLKPVLELGHLAHARGLTPTKAPSLETIVNVLWPGTQLEGKHGTDSPRCTNWANSPLTLPQKLYAGCDGYSPAVSYKRMMQIMDPREQGRLLKRDATDGIEVTLYSKAFKTRVVEGVIRTVVNNKVNVEIDLDHTDKIYATGICVDVVGQDGSVESRQSIASLQKHFMEIDDASSKVIIRWTLYFTRRTQLLSAEDSIISIRTRKVKVLAEDNEDGELQEQNYSADDDAGLPSRSDSGSECNSSDG